MSTRKPLRMRFDPSTINHLGISLYSTLPPVIGELVANAYDADAENVHIYLDDRGEKEIRITDDGHGMTYDELNSRFLVIGRNRRKHNESLSRTKNRPTQGRKGLGKLSVFGIAKNICITSISNSSKTSFSMDYEELEKTFGEYNEDNPKSSEYEPEIINDDTPTTEPSGTSIILKSIARKSDFDPSSLAVNLSKRFSIYGSDFKVTIHHNDTQEIQVSNEMKFQHISPQFEWSFPEDFHRLLPNDNYGLENSIHGKIYTSATPISGNDSGIILMARGKLVQDHTYFGDRANDLFHTYLTGYLHVDFIDDDPRFDLVSTDRKSLKWEHDVSSELRTFLNSLIKKVGSEWKSKRKALKESEIKETFGIDLDTWINTLPAHDRKLGKNLMTAVVNNNAINVDKANEMVQHIQEVFGFNSFKEFASKLESADMLDSENAIKLLHDWHYIESGELAKIAIGRIETIQQFEKLIVTNASETKYVQPFLEKFPWILDPKMTHFEREVYYSRILKENFPDDKLDESNRRIDFLCTSSNGVIHVIELKRPGIKISINEVHQVADYVSFIKEKVQNARTVVGYLISDNFTTDRSTEMIIDSLAQTDRVHLKSYSELLADAKTYHREFIKIYDQLKESKKSITASSSESVEITTETQAST